MPSLLLSSHLWRWFRPDDFLAPPGGRDGIGQRLGLVQPRVDSAHAWRPRPEAHSGFCAHPANGLPARVVETRRLGGGGVVLKVPFHLSLSTTRKWQHSTVAERIPRVIRLSHSPYKANHCHIKYKTNKTPQKPMQKKERKKSKVKNPKTNSQTGSDSPVILKIGHGHQKWNEQVNINSSYHHAKVERSHLNTVWEKANITCLSIPEMYQWSQGWKISFKHSMRKCQHHVSVKFRNASVIPLE